MKKMVFLQKLYPLLVELNKTLYAWGEAESNERLAATTDSAVVPFKTDSTMPGTRKPDHKDNLKTKRRGPAYGQSPKGESKRIGPHVPVPEPHNEHRQDAPYINTYD